MCPTTTAPTVNSRQSKDAQAHSGERSNRDKKNVRPRKHWVPGARVHRHCTLRRPGPQIRETGATVAICAQTGERPHRAYTLAPPLLPSKGRTHIRMPPDITPAAATDLPDILELLAASKLPRAGRSEEHTSELQSPCNLVCRLLLEKKKKTKQNNVASETE